MRTEFLRIFEYSTEYKDQTTYSCMLPVKKWMKICQYKYVNGTCIMYRSEQSEVEAEMKLKIYRMTWHILNTKLQFLHPSLPKCLVELELNCNFSPRRAPYLVLTVWVVTWLWLLTWARQSVKILSVRIPNRNHSLTLTTFHFLIHWPGRVEPSQVWTSGYKQLGQLHLTMSKAHASLGGMAEDKDKISILNALFHSRSREDEGKAELHNSQTHSSPFHIHFYIFTIEISYSCSCTDSDFPNPEISPRRSSWKKGNTWHSIKTSLTTCICLKTNLGLSVSQSCLLYKEFGKSF
jgi:hypothetical protein